MTDPITPIMQAAERLRRFRARPNDVSYEEWGANIYPEARTIFGDELDSFNASEWIRMKAVEDRETLNDHYLSILPKGDRPVPIENPEDKQDAFVADGGEVLPVRYQDGHWEHGYMLEAFLGTSIEYMPVLGAAYPTEADAKLALQWQKFDELLAASP